MHYFILQYFLLWLSVILYPVECYYSDSQMSTPIRLQHCLLRSTWLGSTTLPLTSVEQLGEDKRVYRMTLSTALGSKTTSTILVSMFVLPITVGIVIISVGISAGIFLALAWVGYK